VARRTDGFSLTRGEALPTRGDSIKKRKKAGAFANARDRLTEIVISGRTNHCRECDQLAGKREKANDGTHTPRQFTGKRKKCENNPFARYYARPLWGKGGLFCRNGGPGRGHGGNAVTQRSWKAKKRSKRLDKREGNESKAKILRRRSNLGRTKKKIWKERNDIPLFKLRIQEESVARSATTYTQRIGRTESMSKGEKETTTPFEGCGNPMRPKEQGATRKRRDAHIWIKNFLGAKGEGKKGKGDSGVLTGKSKRVFTSRRGAPRRFQEQDKEALVTRLGTLHCGEEGSRAWRQTKKRGGSQMGLKKETMIATSKTDTEKGTNCDSYLDSREKSGGN